MSASSETPKKRSPVERAIVWGAILILVGVVIYEYRARSAYDSSMGRLNDAYTAADENDKSLTADDVAELMTGYADVTVNKELPINPIGATREDKYTFNSLLAGTREIYVYYGTAGADGAPPAVLQFQTEAVATNQGQGYTGSDLHKKLDALTDENDTSEDDGDDDGGRPGAGGGQSDAQPKADEPETEEPADTDAAEGSEQPAEKE